MRRHAAYFRLGATTGVDLSPELKKPPDSWFSRKAQEAVTKSFQDMANCKLTGRTVVVICLMLLIGFTVLIKPNIEELRNPNQRKENVKELVVSLENRFVASESRRLDSPLGLTKSQLAAYTLALNLSESYEAMIMSSMWDGWKRMTLARRAPAITFQKLVNATLQTWIELLDSLNADDLAVQTGGSTVVCPASLSNALSGGFEAKEEGGNIVKYVDVLIPCGLHLDSTVTIVGKPIKNFYVQLMRDTSVVYKVEVVFDDYAAPFILQSQPYAVAKWEKLKTERCPASTRQWPASLTNTFVDSLHPCSDALSKPWTVKPKEELENEDIFVGHFPGLNVLDETWWFPFIEGQPFLLTMTFGLEGYHINVDGNYVCSFLYNQTGKVLESITAVRIGGDVLPISVIANGLFMPRKSLPIPDHLKAPLTALDDEKVEMLIGVTSGSIQFERRMGVRRTWAQYPEIRSGRALLRFFVGLTRKKNLNRRIFKEANLFKDVVILPFVDDRRYEVLKTIAMCKFMIKYTQTPFLLKTEDDTFVRVDAALPAVVTLETNRGLLYASIEEKGLPAHELKSPWYSSKKEWPWSSYPKFPRGPGYAISRDVADFITKKYEDKSLELFRVESVAMGIWVDLYQRQYLHRVNYIHDPTLLRQGCVPGYTIAHGQTLQQMLCLWQRLQNWEEPLCCNNPSLQK